MEQEALFVIDVNSVINDENTTHSSIIYDHNSMNLESH